MKNVFFNPWIGKDYESGGIFGKKLLVLGEAHLCAGCQDCEKVENAEECADFTSYNCIEVLLEGHTDGRGRSASSSVRLSDTKPALTKAVRYESPWHSTTMSRKQWTTKEKRRNGLTSAITKMLSSR